MDDQKVKIRFHGRPFVKDYEIAVPVKMLDHLSPIQLTRRMCEEYPDNPRLRFFFKTVKLGEEYDLHKARVQEEKPRAIYFDAKLNPDEPLSSQLNIPEGGTVDLAYSPIHAI